MAEIGLVALNMSMANWARAHLADARDIEIPRDKIFSMVDPRRLDGLRLDTVYVYDPIRPGESSSVMNQREKTRRHLSWMATKMGDSFQGFYQLMPNGSLHGPTETL